MNKTDLINKLENEKVLVTWDKLSEQADKIIIVSNKLKLEDAGAVISLDDTHQVKEWIQDGTLRRPLESDVQSWKALQDKKFYFLIISPYILIQELLN